MFSLFTSIIIVIISVIVIVIVDNALRRYAGLGL